MTKDEFMRILEQELAGVPEDEKAYFIRYCREMIEDRMEEGVPEAEAVGTREELDAAVRAFRQENGYGQPAPRSAGTQDVGIWTLPASQVRSLFIDVSNIRICCREGRTDQIEISYPVDEERLETEKSFTPDGQMHLKIRGKERRFLFGLFSWSWVSGEPDPVTVCVPSGYAGGIRLVTGNAAVIFEHGGTSGDLSIETSNARIEFRTALRQGGTVSCRTSNARIEFEDLRAAAIDLTTSNGSLRGTNATAQSIVMRTSNASVRMGTLAAADIALSTSNGTISLDHADAGSVTMTTSNASVRARLAGGIRDYGIESSCSHGNNTLPTSMPGGVRQLKVSTSNGSINVKFDLD